MDAVSAKFGGGVAVGRSGRERPRSKPGSSQHMVIFDLVKVRRRWSATFRKATELQKRVASLSLVRRVNLTTTFLPANVRLRVVLRMVGYGISIMNV
jgi:hypothetical protein